jgi:transcription antitermination factor NusG
MPDDKKHSATRWSEEQAGGNASRLRDAGSLQWFGLAVKPRFDKAVARTLESKGFETLLPLYKKEHKYAAHSREFELPLFPGYVFCRFGEMTKLPIVTTPGVTHILGAGSTPMPLDETEIASLRIAMQAGVPVQPCPFLEGQRVRINGGVLEGVEGIVMSFRQPLRMVLSITLLHRSVLLEVDRDQVQVEQVPKTASPGGRYDNLSTVRSSRQ